MSACHRHRVAACLSLTKVRLLDVFGCFDRYYCCRSSTGFFFIVNILRISPPRPREQQGSWLRMQPCALPIGVHRVDCSVQLYTAALRPNLTMALGASHVIFLAIGSSIVSSFLSKPHYCCGVLSCGTDCCSAATMLTVTISGFAGARSVRPECY